jgi:hypothetical protein
VPGRNGSPLPKLLKVSVALATSLLLSGCNIGCWFAPCDRSLEVTARVTDPSGAPLPGAHVDINGKTGETDKNGCLEIEGVIHSNELDLHATAPGHKPYDQQKSFDSYEVDIVLERATSADPSSGTWKNQSTQDNRLHCSQGTPG